MAVAMFICVQNSKLGTPTEISFVFANTIRRVALVSIKTTEKVGDRSDRARQKEALNDGTEEYLNYK